MHQWVLGASSVKYTASAPIASDLHAPLNMLCISPLIRRPCRDNTVTVTKCAYRSYICICLLSTDLLSTLKVYPNTRGQESTEHTEHKNWWGEGSMDTAAGFVRNEYAYVRSVLFFVVQLRGYLHEYGAVPRCECGTE